MKRKPNPYIKRYKKLHRQKMARKRAIDKYRNTMDKLCLSIKEMSFAVRKFTNSLKDLSDKINDDSLDCTIYAFEHFIKGECIDDISKVEDCGDTNKKILEMAKEMKNRLSYNEPIITTSRFRLNGEYYELAED